MILFIDYARTCEAIEEQADSFAVGGADEVAVAEERCVGLVERDGGEVVESRVGNEEKEREEEGKETKHAITT
jgi:hypothetical protein